MRLKRAIQTAFAPAALTAGLCAVIPMSPARAGSSSCSGAVSTVDIQNCQQDQLKAANVALNAIYQRRLAALSPSRRAQLRADERSWITQRDRTCAVKPDSGTSGSLDTGECLLRETQARTRVLGSK